jgi:hypothetical protein
MNKNVGKYFFIIKNGISIYTSHSLSPPRFLSLFAVLFTESRWNMMKTRAEKKYFAMHSEGGGDVAAVPCRHHSTDEIFANLPWRTLRARKILREKLYFKILCQQSLYKKMHFINEAFWK